MKLLEYIDMGVDAFAGLALVYGIYTTWRHFRVTGALGYIERFNSEYGVKLRTEVDEWLAIEDDEEKLRIFESNREFQNKVKAFMNLFQELGTAYQKRLVDKGVVHTLFDYLVPHYWDKLGFLIDHYRDLSGDDSVYRRFRYIAQKLRATSR